MELDLCWTQFHLSSSPDQTGPCEATRWGEESQVSLATLHQLQPRAREQKPLQGAEQQLGALVVELQQEKEMTAAQAERIAELEVEAARLAARCGKLEVRLEERREEKTLTREQDTALIHQLSQQIQRLQTSGQDSSGDTDSGCHMAEEPDPLADLPAKFAELEAELRVLRDQNSRLHESGRNSASQGEEPGSPSQKERLLQSLRSQEEKNAQLQGYIDNVLINIMEKYPELLEKK